MRTRVRLAGPTEKRASRAQASVRAAPRSVDVVDERANTHMMHMRAKGRRPQVDRRRLSTILEKRRRTSGQVGRCAERKAEKGGLRHGIPGVTKREMA